MNKLDGFMLLGWYLTRPALRPAKALPRPELLPETIVSGTDCFCAIHPDLVDDVYCLDKEDMYQLLSVSSNDFGNVCYLRTPAMAAWANERFFQNSQGIYGLAVHSRRLAALCREVGLCSDDKRPADVWVTPAQGDEIPLGYDVMGYNYGWNGFHCNYLQDELFDVFGARLNEHGLIGDYELAETFSCHINARGLGEPGLYLPYAILRPAEARYCEEKAPVPARWECWPQNND